MNRARLIEKLETYIAAIEWRWATMPYLGIKVRRIRSIIRRLKRCPACLGRRVVYGRFVGEVRYMQLECQKCNGTGRIAQIQQ